MESGLVLQLSDLATVVDRWRLPTVPTAAAGGPVHVTALYPWLAAPTTPEQRTELAEVLADQSPVELTDRSLR